MEHIRDARQHKKDSMMPSAKAMGLTDEDRRAVAEFLATLTGSAKKPEEKKPDEKAPDAKKADSKDKENMK